MVGAAALAPAAVPGSDAEIAASRIADLLFGKIQEARRTGGIPELERRPELDAAVLKAAAEVAANGGRGLNRPIERVLRESEVDKFLRAVPLVQSFRGFRDPAGTAFERWREYGPAWKSLMDPAFGAAGIGALWMGDGTIVLVGVLVEDLPPPVAPETLERRTLEAVNEIRAEHGLPGLKMSPELARIAREHSLDMARREYFSHSSPEGRRVEDRVASARVRFRRVAENISMSRSSGDAVRAAVDGWMESRSHRSQILRRRYSRTGVGVAMDDDGVFYFTQIFVEPPAEAIESSE
jgi:uncharacterized protein YkwD